jgi:hypothetical protein
MILQLTYMIFCSMRTRMSTDLVPLVDLSEFQFFDTELNLPLDYSRTNELMYVHLQWRQHSNRVPRLHRDK